MCILKPLLVAACWLRQVGQASVTGRGTDSSANSSAGIKAALELLPENSHREPVSFPLGPACIPLWLPGMFPAGHLPVACLAGRVSAAFQACTGMLPGCWGAVLAGTEWSSSGPLWIPLSPALSVFFLPSCCGHFWAALCSQQILNCPFWFNFLAFLSSPLLCQ